MSGCNTSQPAKSPPFGIKARRHARQLLEDAVEMAGRIEAHLVGDLLHCLAAIGQHLDCPHHPLMVHVIAETDARSVEQAAQAPDRQPILVGDTLDRQALADMVLHIVQDRQQAGIVRDNQRLQQDFRLGHDQGQEPEKGQREIKKRGLLLTIDHGSLGSDELQVAGDHRVRIVNGELPLHVLVRHFPERHVKDHQRDLPVIAADLMVHPTRDPGDVLLRHEIACPLDLYVNRPHKRVNDLILLVGMGDHINLLLPRFAYKDLFIKSSVHEIYIFVLLWNHHCPGSN